MNLLTAVKTGPLYWDFYVTEEDEFLGSVGFENFDLEKRTCHLKFELGEADFTFDHYLESFRFVTENAIFERNMTRVHVALPIEDQSAHNILVRIGYLVGREFSQGKTRMRRYSCDRYDLVRALAEAQMAEHLDLNLWTFGWDSAKRRLGVCKYDQHLISLSRYFVDLHPLDDIDQVMRHEIAHALAGPKAGHGVKWKRIATSLGYHHKRISGEQIGNATAKLVGTCPNGHTVYRHRKPKTVLSCSICSTRFDRRYLITWTAR